MAAPGSRRVSHGQGAMDPPPLLKTNSVLDVDLESRKEKIKADIRKELKIKEGADNMAKVAKDARQRRSVSAVLKTCQTKISNLQLELEKLNVVVADSVGKPSTLFFPFSWAKFPIWICSGWKDVFCLFTFVLLSKIQLSAYVLSTNALVHFCGVWCANLFPPNSFAAVVQTDCALFIVLYACESFWYQEYGTLSKTNFLDTMDSVALFHLLENFHVRTEPVY